MNLYGMVLFYITQRTKEIGIRKVNGARVFEILTLLNKDFIIWVTAAFIVACPVAYLAMSSWLDNFAYKTSISWWIYASAAGITLTITLVTVSIQCFKAAARNPIEALRFE